MTNPRAGIDRLQGEALSPTSCEIARVSIASLKCKLSLAARRRKAVRRDAAAAQRKADQLHREADLQDRIVGQIKAELAARRGPAFARLQEMRRG